MRRSLLLLSALLLVFAPAPADDVPVAPLAPERGSDGGSRFHLRSERLNLHIDPVAGTLVSLRAGNSDEMLPRPVALLPFGLELPPDAAPWESRGWKTSDGAQVVMLNRRLPAPLGYALNVLVHLPPGGARITLTTRVTALTPSPDRPLPLGLYWPLPENEAVWTRSITENGSAGWVAELESKPSPFATFARQTDRSLLLWRWRQHLEDGPVLESELLRNSTTLEASHALFLSTTPPLPPQGWTLVSELRIDLLPLTETDTPCKLLESIHPAEGG